MRQWVEPYIILIYVHEIIENICTEFFPKEMVVGIFKQLYPKAILDFYQN